MIAQTVRIPVPTPPLSKGSKTGFVRDGRAVLVEVADLATTTRAKGALTAWLALIAWKARERYRGAPWPGPVLLSCVFALPIPRSYLRKDGRIRKGKPLQPIGKPDLDKLTRAICDALTGIVYRDDAQVVGYRPPYHKRWARPGALGGVYLELDLCEPEAPEWAQEITT